MFDRRLRRFEDLRRPGAASLDLAWVASGVFEGFFGLGLSPWDVAASSLFVEEAGGVVTTWDGGSDSLRGHPGRLARGSPGAAGADPRLSAAASSR